MLFLSKQQLSTSLYNLFTPLQAKNFFKADRKFPLLPPMHFWSVKEKTPLPL